MTNKKESPQYIIAYVGEWNDAYYKSVIRDSAFRWHLVNTPDNLLKSLENITPRYIFFPHWRWIVPKSIISRFECVCFHMTDLPYGRGGSPLQNLILRGHDSTVLTALKMSEEIDAGPIYLKEPLTLEGTAKDIYLRASKLSWLMMNRLIEKSIEPIEQKGTPTYFKRRTPQESEIPNTIQSAKELYNFIRMLDAPGYPKAFYKTDRFKIEFSNPRIEGARVFANSEWSFLTNFEKIKHRENKFSSILETE